MYHTIFGKVIRGDGYGRKLGFPTVNLETGAKELPPDGVYAGVAVIEGKEPRTRASSVQGRYRAGIVIGPGKKVEAHLIGYNGDAYGKEVSLELQKFLREYKKFGTEKELIAQIKKDIEQCSQE
ncbi:MAG: riboflavin kinase [Patescibacteria group bacterium]